MNPLDKEVAEWLESLGFFRSVGQAWMHNDVGGDILPPQATFFYTAFKAQREQIFNDLLQNLPKVYTIEALERTEGRDLENMQWRKALDKLLAQLNNSNKENE